MKIPEINQKQILEAIQTGSPFQQKVWSELLKIPYGQTRTYKQIAEAINKPKAIRAVASAIAANKLYYQIPFHRVIRSDGQIGDYRWGKDLKYNLIQKEASH